MGLDLIIFVSCSCLVLITITVPSLFSFLFEFICLSGLLFLCAFLMPPVQDIGEFLDMPVALCFCSCF